MADTTVIRIEGFISPGIGRQMTVTDATGSSSVDVNGAITDLFLCITNYGIYPAFVRWGRAPIVATTECQCVLPGTQTIWGIPTMNQATLYVAAVCEAGETTKLQVTRGNGN